MAQRYDAGVAQDEVQRNGEQRDDGDLVDDERMAGQCQRRGKGQQPQHGLPPRKRRACSNDAAAAEDEGAGFIVPNPRKGA